MWFIQWKIVCSKYVHKRVHIPKGILTQDTRHCVDTYDLKNVVIFQIFFVIKKQWIEFCFYFSWMCIYEYNWLFHAVYLKANNMLVHFYFKTILMLLNNLSLLFISKHTHTKQQNTHTYIHKHTPIHTT